MPIKLAHDQTMEQCRDLAAARMQPGQTKYFAMQDGKQNEGIAECWFSDSRNYMQWGTSQDCWVRDSRQNNLGGSWANYVYEITRT